MLNLYFNIILIFYLIHIQIECTYIMHYVLIYSTFTINTLLYLNTSSYIS